MTRITFQHILNRVLNSFIRSVLVTTLTSPLEDSYKMFVPTCGVSCVFVVAVAAERLIQPVHTDVV